MIRGSRRGFTGGRGNLWVPLWLHHESAPRVLGPGGDGCWLDDDTVLFAGPTPAGWRVSQARPETNWQPEPFAPAKDFATTNLRAAAGRWMATRVERDRGLIAVGTIPVQYTLGWDCHDIGPDGTIVFVRNGVFDVLWSDGSTITQGLRVAQLRATEGALVCVDFDGRIRLRFQNGSIEEPAQLDGAEWHVTAIRDALGDYWLSYLAPGVLWVTHPHDNAKRGYQQHLIAASPLGLTLDDGRTSLICAIGDGEQAADLRRFVVTLGDGMTDLVPAPIPVPPSARIVWRGYSNAYATDPGNMTQGYYKDDPRPTIEGATWLQRPDIAADLKAHPEKLLGVHWSPHEGWSERAAAIEESKASGEPIGVYCDRPRVTQLCLDALADLLKDGHDAFMEIQAYPSADDYFDPDACIRRITEEVEKLERAGETRIGLRRIGRYGNWSVDTVEAMQAGLTQLVEDHPSIVSDIAFEARAGRTPRLIEYFAGLCAAMPPGTPARLSRVVTPPAPRPTPPAPVPPQPPTPTPPAPPAEEDEDSDMLKPTDPIKYCDAIAKVVADLTGMPQGHEPFTTGKGVDDGAWQGCWETLDRLQKHKQRISAVALATGALLRPGSRGVKIEHDTQDRIAKAIQDANIDQEFLR